MKRTLVNHGGIIQWKFLISNDEQLFEYAKHKSLMVGEEFRGMIHKDYKKSDKPDTQTQKILKMTSESERVSLIGACDVLVKRVIMSMHKQLLKGETLVVNEAGGYCPWDSSMELIEATQENIDIANGVEPKNQILSNLNDGPILVLENQSEIPEAVEEYIHMTLGVPKFSYIKNIQFGKDKMRDLIKEALIKKHHTFVAQTAMMDDKQIEDIAFIMEAIPHKVSFLINTSEDIKENLIGIIGEERTEALFAKHNIIKW